MREELCVWSVCRSLYGWLGESMCHVMARLIFLDVGFVPDFAVGLQSHGAAVVLALSTAQSGLARVLPRRDGVGPNKERTQYAYIFH